MSVLFGDTLNDLGIVWPKPDLQYKDQSTICIGIVSKDGSKSNAYLSIRDSGFEIQGWNVSRCKRVEVLNENKICFQGKGKNKQTITLFCGVDRNDFVTIVSWIGKVVSERRCMSLSTKQRYTSGDHEVSDLDNSVYITKKRTMRSDEIHGILDRIKDVRGHPGSTFSYGPLSNTFSTSRDSLSDIFKKYQRMFRGAVGRGFNQNIFKPLYSSVNSQLVYDSGRIKFSTKTNSDTRRVLGSGMDWVIRQNRSGSWTCQIKNGTPNVAMTLRNIDVTPCAMWLVLQARLHHGISLELLSVSVKKRPGDPVANRTRSKCVRGKKIMSVQREYNTRSKGLSKTIGK